MAHVDLTSLRLFVTVCEAGSIAHGATRAHVAASAVSKRIADLEDRMGTQLLQRHQKGVTPTPAGERLLHHARTVLHGLDAMCADISEYSTKAHRGIRLAAGPVAAASGLLDDLAAFRASLHDEVHVHFMEQADSVVAQSVMTEVADIGIGGGLAEGRHLQAFPYREERLMAAVRADHPLACRATVAFRETLAFDHVFPSGEETLTQLLNFAAAETGVTFRPRMRVLTFDSACRVVRTNLAIAIVPEAVAQSWAGAGDLRGVRIEDPWAYLKLYLLVRDFRALPVDARRLVQRLVQTSANRWRKETAAISAYCREPSNIIPLPDRVASGDHWEAAGNGSSRS